MQRASSRALASKGPSSREAELARRIEQLEVKLAKRTRSSPRSLRNMGPKKSARGALSGRWVPHDTRDTVVDFITAWSTKTDIAQDRFIRWVGVNRGKFFHWKQRYGKANEHRSGAAGDPR